MMERARAKAREGVGGKKSVKKIAKKKASKDSEWANFGRRSRREESRDAAPPIPSSFAIGERKIVIQLGEKYTLI